MKAVADDIHALGLPFGMYSSAGEMTCARFGRRLTLKEDQVSKGTNYSSWSIGFRNSRCAGVRIVGCGLS